VQALHLVFLLGVVIAAHHAVVFLGLFLFFLGLVSVTKEYQSELKIKEALLVGFFLAGLVVLGGPQRWWLEPIISNLSVLPLYFGTMSLTAVTDNAALTYLGSLVEGLSDSAKYALVAGSVIGGGLTVIANAPNPAGYGILNKYFGPEGISPLKLFLGALPPTIVAAVIFWP
jgi:Na+/H+ antiporter NhaD/arsenite permease-like protein